MKPIIIFVFFLYCSNINAQSFSINTDGSIANASAILDVKSTTKGVLVSRMTALQRNAIASPANGLLLYDVDSLSFTYYNGANWVFIKSGSDTSKSWGINGNNNTNATTNFIGTTNANDLIFKVNNIKAGYIRINTNTALGYNAGNNGTGINNTAFGSQSMQVNTTGLLNTAIGYQSLQTNSTGSNNVAVGVTSLKANTIGLNNVALGARSLLTNNIGNSNIAIGSFSMQNHRLKDNNVAIGQSSLSLDTSGASNVSIGFNSLIGNRKGAYNTSLGASSLPNNIIGDYNTGVGYLTDVTDSIGNATAIGSYAFVSQSNSLVLGSIEGINGATNDTKVGISVTDPTEKLEIGKGRLKFRGNLTNGNAHGITFTDNAGTQERAFIGMENDDMFGINNVAFGWNVRVHNNTGEVGINKQPSNNVLDSRLQVKQIDGGQNGIGIEAANSSNHWDWYVNSNANSDLSLLYNGIIKGTYDNVSGNYIISSDKRLKKNISLLPSVIKDIKRIEAYNYYYLDNKISDNLSNGFMAQDVQKVFPNAVFENQLKNGEKRLGINYQYFTVLAIKGIQEQQQQIELQDKKITDLQMQIDEIKQLLKKN